MKKLIYSTRMSSKSSRWFNRVISFVCGICLILNLLPKSSLNVQAANSPPVETYLKDVSVNVENKNPYSETYDKDFYGIIESAYATSYTTENAPLEIGTAGELAAFAAIVNSSSDYNFKDKYVKLKNDINLEGTFPTIEFPDNGDGTFNVTVSGTCENAWTPIGLTADTLFAGTFDGGGCTVSGMVVLPNPTTDCYGLFGASENANLKSVGIKDSVVIANHTSGCCVGGLVARFHGTMSDCYNFGDVYSCCNSGDTYVGGLSGQILGTEIVDCYNAGAVHAFGSVSNVGGIAGASSLCSFHGCYSAGDLYVFNETADTTSHFGGLFGWFLQANLSSCFHTGSMYSSSSLSTTHFYNGRLVGNFDDSSMSNCYSLGDMYCRSPGSEFVTGGAMGIGAGSGSISYCYHAGKVVTHGENISTRSSGVCGALNSSAELTFFSCYYDTDVAGNIGALAGTDDVNNFGLATTEMKGEAAKTHMNGFSGAKDTVSGNNAWSFNEYQYPMLTAIDPSVPSITISIDGQENLSWSTFQTDITTFTTVFSSTSTAKIEATDDESGIASIKYYLSDKELTRTEANSLDDSLWETYDDSAGIALSTEKNYIVYAKATNKLGYTNIVNSTGFVISTSPAIPTETIYAEHTKGLTVQLTLNGHTVATITNTTTGTNLEKDTDYTITADGTLTFSATYIESLDVGTNEISISFNSPDGLETISKTFEVYVLDASTVSFGEINGLTKVYDAKPISPVYNVTRVDNGDPVAVDVTFTYYDSNGNDIGGAPTNAGTYKLKATMAEVNYGGTVSGEATVLILKARWIIIIIEQTSETEGLGNDELTYTINSDASAVTDPQGNEYPVEKAVSVNDKNYYIAVIGVSGETLSKYQTDGNSKLNISYEIVEESGTTDLGDTPPTNSGMYMLKVTATNCINYEDTMEEIGFVIEGTSGGSITINGSLSKVYDGNTTSEPSYTIFDADNNDITANYKGIISIDYWYESDGKYHTVSPINAGTYKVRVTAQKVVHLGDGNYNYSNGEPLQAEEDFYISKCYVTVKIS